MAAYTNKQNTVHRMWLQVYHLCCRRRFPSQLESESSVGQMEIRSRLTRIGVSLGLSTGLTETPFG